LIIFSFIIEKTRKDAMQTKKKIKEKVGTILDRDVVRKVKYLSIKEGRTISDIIQDAIIKYDEVRFTDTDIRKAAVYRFCSMPFKLETKDIIELLDEDIYEQ
jgi:hypothetical protein